MSMDFERMAASMDDFLKSYQEAQNEAGRYRGYASKLIEARNELDAANEQCLRLQDDCERFARVNDSLIEENEVLKKKLDQAEKFRESIVHELQTDVNQLKAENDRLRERGGSYVSDNESLQAKLKHTEMVWREENKALNAEIHRLRQELDEEQKGHSSTATTAMELSCELNQLRIELRDERDRFDRLSDFEVAEAKKLEQLRAQVKRDERIYNTVMALLRKEGRDVPALALETAFIVAAMELRDKE